MSNKHLAFTAALTLAAGSLMAQQPQTLPLDPDVRTGVLDNGITYYLRHNNWPEGRTSFFLAQRVGSLQEEETQLGLAHFLEHMCFNGTEHFPGNAVWDFIQRNGINNNAETAFDRTLYHIDNVPSTIGSAGIDTCLIILADWAHGLTLDANEINKERDVIHGEYRLRMQGEGRILLTELPKLYPGRYGQRYPIGTMEVVDNFQHKELVDYYHKWYNPENQAVIVVGDIDLDEYEQKVKKLFAGLQPHEGAGKVESYSIDPTEQIYFSIAQDKDINTNVVRYCVTLPELPREFRNTDQAQLINFALSAAAKALDYRFADMAPKAETPWMHAFATRGTIVSEKLDAFNIETYPKDGQMIGTLNAIVTELRRLVQYGITQDEYDRFLQEYNQQIDNFEANKDKQDNSIIATQLSKHFFFGDACLSPDMDIMLSRQFAQMLPVAVVNQIAAQFICTTGQNTSVWCWEKEKEGATYVSREELEATFQAAQMAEVEAPADNSIKEPLMAQIPTAGTITSESDAKFGFKQLTLSNGVRVYIRKSDVEPNSIYIQGTAHVGTQQFETAEFANFDNADEIPLTIGGWNIRQIQKLLAGKKVGFNLGMDENTHSVAGQAGTKDLETMFQLAHLYFTNIGRDDEMYANILSQLRTILPNRKTNTDAIFRDSVNVILNCHDPRHRTFEVEDIDQMDYDRMLDMQRLALNNAANFDFIISGDFDEAELRQLLCQYIASLPSKGKADTFRTLKDRQLQSKTVCDFKTPMTEPKVLSETHWMNYKMPVTAENTLMASLASRILNNAHFRVIREEMSATYTPYSNRNYALDPNRSYIDIMASHTGLKPELADQALAYTDQSIIDLTNQCSDEELTKAQEEIINNLRESRDTQVYFYIIALRNWIDYSYDTVSIFEEFIKAQTPATIKAWVKTFLQDAIEAQIIARPE